MSRSQMKSVHRAQFKQRRERLNVLDTKSSKPLEHLHVAQNLVQETDSTGYLPPVPLPPPLPPPLASEILSPLSGSAFAESTYRGSRKRSRAHRKRQTTSNDSTEPSPVLVVSAGITIALDLFPSATSTLAATSSSSADASSSLASPSSTDILLSSASSSIVSASSPLTVDSSSASESATSDSSVSESTSVTSASTTISTDTSSTSSTPISSSTFSLSSSSTAESDTTTSASTFSTASASSSSTDSTESSFSFTPTTVTVISTIFPSSSSTMFSMSSPLTTFSSTPTLLPPTTLPSPSSSISQSSSSSSNHDSSSSPLPSSSTSRTMIAASSIPTFATTFLTTQFFTTTEYSVTTLSDGSTSLVPTATSTRTQVITTGILSTNPPDLPNKNAFARNTGAIVGVSLGGVVALIAGVFVVFLFCKRVRHRQQRQLELSAEEMGERERAGGPVSGAGAGRTSTMAKLIGIGGAAGAAGASQGRNSTRGGGTLSRLARGGSGSAHSSSRRMLNRNYSSGSSAWRPPLTGEDDVDEEEYSNGHMSAGGHQQPPLSPISPASASRGFGFGDDSLSGHGHGSSSGHGHGQGQGQGGGGWSVESSGSRNASSQQHGYMSGIGQVAATMAAGAPSPTSPTAPGLGPGGAAVGVDDKDDHHGLPVSPEPSAFSGAGSASSHDHSSHQDHLFRTASSLNHNTTAPTSGSSNSHSHSGGHGGASEMGLVIPRVKINDVTRPSSIAENNNVPPSPRGKRKQSTTDASSVKGFIERLRGGRSSTYGTPSTPSAPASSSYYPATTPAPKRSSLLNPPVPTHSSTPMNLADMFPPGSSSAEHAQASRPWLPATPDLPSPAPTEEYADGLLNPALSPSYGAAHLEQASESRPSLGSFTDNVDYSRPFRGFVFNRMDSSSSVTTTDTRTTRTAHATPALETPRDLDNAHHRLNEFPFNAL